jgi:hypothetical protein
MRHAEQRNMQMKNELTLVKAGLIKFEIIPLGPFLPFAELFEKIPAKE